MLAFLLRRILFAFPLLLGVTFMVFVIMYLAPGDFLSEARNSQDVPPELVQSLEQRYGLDQPWYVQYIRWLQSVATLNLGESWTYKLPVTDLLAQRIPATLVLSFTSLALAWCIAIPLAVLAAIYKDSWFDRISQLLAYAAISIPEFFLAILAVFFAAVTGILPVGGRTSIEHDFMSRPEQFIDYLHHLILPSLVLAVGGIAGTMRVLRANFLDYMRAEFATTARAKGLPERVVMFKHVLRNAINPLITSLGFAFSSLLSGALLVEMIMNYPGLGQLTYAAVLNQDQYLVMAGVMMGSLMLLAGNVLADVLLAWSDPRTQIESGGNGVRPVHSIYALGAIIILYAAAAAFHAWFPWDHPGWRDILHAAGGLSLALLFFAAVALVAAAAYYGWKLGAPLVRSLLPALLRRPLGGTALVVLLFMYGAALFAPFLAPYTASQQNLPKAFHPPTAVVWQDGALRVRVYENVDPGSASYLATEETRRITFLAQGEPYKLLGIFPATTRLFQLEQTSQDDRIYLLGSDGVGRDIFSRLLFGAQVSLSIGLVGITITMLMGFIVGGLSGYFGGTFDFVSMRIVEFLMAVPGLYLLLALRSALAPYFEPAQMYLVIIIILSIIGWSGTARVIRGMSLSLSRRPFVQAAEAMGQTTTRILQRHLLPNLSSYLLVSATLAIPGYILGEAALSFLGLGIQEPAASWGLMLKQSQEDMKVFMLNFWWMLTPGAAIFVTVICFNLVGDALRDIVDPKFRVQGK